MNSVIKFLRDFAEAEARARRAMILERDDTKLAKLIREWDAMYSGLRSGLSRPENVPSKYFEAPSQIAAAEATKPRTLFAVARYEGSAHGEDLYRGWLGDSEPGPRGEALLENVYVTDVKGKLRVISHYTRCSTCLGAMKVGTGKKCPDCRATGWQYRAGAEIDELGPPTEVQKLAEPSDPISKPLYEAIPDPG